MSSQDHGQMDSAQHEKTFRGFVRMATWAGGLSLAFLLLLGLING